MKKTRKQIKATPHHKRQLSIAISMALTSATTFADTFDVTETQDDGTGLVENTLSWAILQANTTAGADTIVLNSDVTITGVMKRLIDSDTILKSNTSRRTIDGNNEFRPLFVKSGQVLIQDVTIANGNAKGGDTGNGGAGAGLGGGLFIYSGNVRLNQVDFTGNSASGGNTQITGKYGGGGMFGSGNFYAGGGLFADAIDNFVNGGYGGYGNYQSAQAPNFGEGGGYVSTYVEAMGGFGGGGAYSYGAVGAHGGFGGGGGFAYNDYSPQFYGGNGGFGAGGGLNFYATSNDGQAGFGGSGQQAAGFGGALFIRSGQLLMEAVQFNSNTATSSGGAEGFGGALFIQHISTQPNGNNQGMPDQTPSVFGCSATFNSNTASTDPSTALNNDNWFDLSDSQLGISGPSITDSCLYDQEIQITGNGTEIVSQDITPSIDDATDFGEVMANFQPKYTTYSINNLGSSQLVFNGTERFEILGTQPSRFSIVQPPNSDNLPGNQSSEIIIAFAPTNWTSYAATVVIRSNDSDEPIYTFAISGEGIRYSELIFKNSFE